MQLADYSAARLTGAQVKGAGFGGSLRYFGTPGRAKNATKAEVQSQLSAGLQMHGIYENTTKDWASGYNGGVTAARALLADANACGVPATSALGVAADMHLTASQCQQFRQYVLGARSVLGARTLAYGFSEAIAAVADLGVFLWQCGSHSALNSKTHVWQRNDGMRAAYGIQLDINEVLKPITVTSSLPIQLKSVISEEITMQYLACQGIDPKNPTAVSGAMRTEAGDFIGLLAGATKAMFQAETAGKIHVDWIQPGDWAEFDRISKLNRSAAQAQVDLVAAMKAAVTPKVAA